MKLDKDANKLKSEKLEDSAKWFALYTKSRGEKKVYEQLKNANYEVFLPIYTTLRQWSDRKKKVQEPLIRQVVFLRIPPKELNDIYRFQLITGVVREFGKPAIIKESEINTLRIVANEWNGELIESENTENLRVGDEIEVIKGSFTGVFGYTTDVKGKHRIVVYLRTLNVQFSINIPKSHVRKVKK